MDMKRRFDLYDCRAQPTQCNSRKHGGRRSSRCYWSFSQLWPKSQLPWFDGAFLRRTTSPAHQSEKTDEFSTLYISVRNRCIDEFWNE